MCGQAKLIRCGDIPGMVKINYLGVDKINYLYLGVGIFQAWLR